MPALEAPRPDIARSLASALGIACLAAAPAVPKAYGWSAPATPLPAAPGPPESGGSR